MSSRIPPAAEGWAKYPPRTPLPPLSLDASITRDKVDASQVVDKWIAHLAESIDRRDIQAFEVLFVQESWWRDLVALTWNVASKYGPKAISAYVLGSTFGLGHINVIRSPSLQPRLEQLGTATFIQAAFSFTNKFGSGRGIARLANVGRNNQWKAWTVSTQLEQLNGPRSVDELMNKQAEQKAGQLQVLVVGGGQCGLSLAAHLEHMGVRYLLVEKTPRIGDSWRNRYSSLKTHTPSTMDSLPFLPYPTNWPKNMTKDQYSDWLECYNRIMKLNTRTSTLIRRIIRDKEKNSYRVDLETNRTVYTITTKHVVLSTGLYSDQPVSLSLPGQDTYQGEIYHSSQHKSASQVSNLANKSVTIVGSGTSAHDIAQDFVNYGAKSVAMIQRNPNIFVSQESLETIMLSLWMTPHLSTEDADLIETSFPNVVALTLESFAMPVCAELDKRLITGMEKAGMVIRKGEDGIGLLDHLILKSGRFYIDHGAAQMIADGRIKIHRSKKGVGAFYNHGLVLADSETKLDSDVIVLATGWERTGKVVQRLLGKDLANAVSAQEWGDLDDESERKSWWRPSGVPGVWCMSGAISWARQYSRVLALQIDAIEKGYNDGYYAVAPESKL